MKNYLNIAFAVIALSSLSLADRHTTFEKNTDRMGSDYKKIDNIDARACRKACIIETPCKAWTFVKENTIQGPNSHCYLKNAIPQKTYNTACTSGLVEKNILSVDDVEKFIAQNGMYVKFVKKNVVNTVNVVNSSSANAIVDNTVGLISADAANSINSLYNRINGSGSSLAQTQCHIQSRLSECTLKQIVDKVKENGHTKLYISIKNKVGGLANRRVDAMKAYLAIYGLSPNKYHVQKVSKKDRKERKWLSKNKHLWIRVASTL